MKQLNSLLRVVTFVLSLGWCQCVDAQSMTFAGTNGAISNIDLNEINSIVFTNSNLVVSGNDCGDRYFNVFTTDYITLNGSIGVGNSVGSLSFWSVFPSPAQDVISLQTFMKPGECIRIYNTLGELLYSGKIQGEITQLNIADFTPGVYVIVVNNQSKSFIKS